ncbi:MAG TPA: 2-C-methyl-D-erythritol 4-phosphate cytidylyltransferase [Candidatus Binatia bacterium]|nr:2-C-methyl-D-erythritol 4-phosphate cytidylyltransferase [Candidatus Binatia bacterium]
MKATAIIVAAGEGRRVGAGINKVYLPIGGRALLLRTLDQFFRAKRINNLIVVIAKQDLGRCQSLFRNDPHARQQSWILQTGGSSRQKSVARGLEKVSSDCDVVVIHDGARPFVGPQLIDRVIEEASALKAVVVGVPVRDTIKVISEDRQILSTPARDCLWEIQTPQAFERSLICEAHEAAQRNEQEATDDAALVERLGKPVYLIDGERTNIKITLPEDLLFAEALVASGRLIK